METVKQEATSLAAHQKGEIQEEFDGAITETTKLTSTEIKESTNSNQGSEDIKQDSEQNIS